VEGILCRSLRSSIQNASSDGSADGWLNLSFCKAIEHCLCWFQCILLIDAVEEVKVNRHIDLIESMTELGPRPISSLLFLYSTAHVLLLCARIKPSFGLLCPQPRHSSVRVCVP